MVNIAIMGLGVVGGGVAEILRRNGEGIARKLGQTMELKTVLVRTLRDGPDREKMTTDFADVESDPDIRVVVETMGGVGAALDYTRRCLLAGKHVVTANKELVAQHGRELLALAQENGVNYLFEASVGGGIPILRPLTQCMAANEIEEVTGILNGTTNYILTRMVRAGASFADALREAQEKGYAEADPTADVAGIDACRKTCILGDLAFGRDIRPERVPTEGITALSLRDVQIAERGGYRVKLLGRALRLPEGGRTAYVAPHLVAEDSPLAGVEDVFNAILVRGNATGEVMFYGKGAGAMPTASAVVADVMDALVHDQVPKDLGWDEDDGKFASPEGLVQRWYVRAAAEPGAVAAALGQADILLAQAGETACLTPPLTQAELTARTAELGVAARLRLLS